MELNKIYHGDCLEGMKSLPDNSVDCCVTDPPYGWKFMGKRWDYEIPKVEVWQEVMRVLKPGAHILVACGTRTQHRMAVNIEDAGFEIRDVISWIYGSGFPKSMDISKQIDKEAGAERGKIMTVKRTGKAAGTYGEYAGNNTITAPATDAAKQWDGWGTALKPAQELWTLARKPIAEKTIAGNVLKYGTGGLNIDGCRIGTDEDTRRNSKGGENGINESDTFKIRQRYAKDAPIRDGRFPTNTIFDEHTAALLDKIGNGKKKVSNHKAENRNTFKYSNDFETLSNYGDFGGASRFFYCAKADPAERNGGNYGFVNGNHHPTVKPLALMQYLIRLICPPGGTVLEPFAGSGTACIAARKEDNNFMAFELNPEYIEIANRRLKSELGLFI